MKTPHFFQLDAAAPDALAHEAAQGLLGEPAQVSPKFFYDALGSRLFDAITELQAYYPTRCESQILHTHGAAIARAAHAACGPAPVMVELGAGNCAKAARLFASIEPRCYVAVDISTAFLRQSLEGLQREHPDRDLVGVGMDFSAGFALPASLPGLGSGQRLVFYPGSSIGNFAPAQALTLLRDMRAAAAGGSLLVGVDLVKPVPLLEAAYDDELGVTAAFNLNLLVHLNRLLGADFRVPQWQHVAVFNEGESRIEMHLQAREDLAVRWPGAQRRFAAGERIHTENSYKWTPEGFGQLLAQAGFSRIDHWRDERGWFAVFLAGS